MTLYTNNSITVGPQLVTVNVLAYHALLLIIDLLTNCVYIYHHSITSLFGKV